MAYKFYVSTLPKRSPKETLIGDFQEALTKEFKVSSDWWTIQEEYPYGSETYRDIDVRINKVISTRTGENLGDDYKTILFSDLSYRPHIGSMYYFDENYWIVSNSEIIKNLAGSAVVKRCNNVLRWRDRTSGSIYSQPCSIGYLIKETRDYSTAGSAMVLPSGFIEVFTQFNERTNGIKPNFRFIFGNKDNWVAYKLMGGGLNNFNNLKTFDNYAVGTVKLSMLVNQVNADIDDLENGIADFGMRTYDINIEESDIELQIGNSYSLSAVVTLNDNTVSRQVTWGSSDSSVVSVNESGVITAVSNGFAIVSCNIQDNNSISDSCVVNVVTVSNNEAVEIYPVTNYIYEGKEQEFNVNTHINGSVSPDTFTFSVVNTGVATNKYKFSVIDGNTFKIKNILRDVQNPLRVRCVSGSNQKDFDIWLKGAW